MDFESLVKKYQDNTATDDEIVFVEDTVNKARKIAKTRLKGDKHVTFLNRVKKFFIKLMVVLLLLASVTVYLYFNISGYAKENMVTGRSSADETVIDFLATDLGVKTSQAEITAYKRKLIICIPFERSYYLYEYTVKLNNRQYYVSLDSYSGLIEYIDY
ncbi:MAG: hypothetical protein QM204_02885 [Bacillota bacterium]|jgi:hypothetical protein|nr:hypothetical protein [Bacillota bacterium]NLL25946.1 hypothetical protein [Erysipelotrichia bacterium]